MYFSSNFNNNHKKIQKNKKRAKLLRIPMQKNVLIQKKVKNLTSINFPWCR